MSTSADRPDAVSALEAVFGPPSRAGFGSAVFWRPLEGGLDEVALATYRDFVGELWERYGEDAWKGPWRRVFARAPRSDRDVAAELRAIGDAEASRSVPLLLELGADPAAAEEALRAAFDGEAVGDVAAYNLGDGGAMSGLLLAGTYPAEDHALVVVALLD